MSSKLRRAAMPLWLAVLAGQLLAVESPAEARRTPQTAFPMLTLSGSPHSMGKRHGRVFRRQIQHNVRFYLGLLAERKMKPERALELAGQFAPALARHAPHLLQEIDGIAKGARCTREQILLLNARTELLAAADREAGKAPSSTSLLTPGCTSLALTNGAGEIALGQNWDWRPQLARGSVILRIKRRGAPDVVTFTEAGMVGKIGCNANRVGVCLNFLGHRREAPAGQVGLPVHVLLRLAMEANSLDEAVSRIARLPRSAAANYLIAQQTAAGPRAVDLETTPDCTARLPLGRSGDLIHTNHFRHRKLRAGCTRQQDPTTLDRLRAGNRRTRQLRPVVTDPVKRAKAVLMDRSERTPISRTAADRLEPTESVTVASVVMGLGKRPLSFDVAGGPPHQQRYVCCPGPCD